MTPEQFTYWLQGFLELNNPESITKEQTQMIKDHLATVFKKVTPNYYIPFNPGTAPVHPYHNDFVTMC